MNNIKYEDLIKLIVLISVKAIDSWEHFNEFNLNIKESRISKFIDKEIRKEVNKWMN